MPRRFVCVRQADQSDCGPAALATVALHHGRHIGREQLRDVAGTDRIGTNLLGMVKAAEQLGFSARAVKGPYEGLAGVPLPAIAHVRTPAGLGHFIVIHRVAEHGVVIADPARGIARITRAQLCAMWSGFVLLLVPRAVPGGADAGASASPLRRFVRLVAAQRGVLIEAFVCAVVMTVLGIATSYFLQHLVDFVLIRRDAGLLDAFGIGMLVIVVFRTLLGALRQYLLAHVGRRSGLELVADYTRHVLRLPIRFFETRRVGEIMSRVSDAAKVRDAITGATLTAARPPTRRRLRDRRSRRAPAVTVVRDRRARARPQRAGAARPPDPPVVARRSIAAAPRHPPARPRDRATARPTTTTGRREPRRAVRESSRSLLSATRTDPTSRSPPTRVVCEIAKIRPAGGFLRRNGGSSASPQ
jgi:hypothetical protein